MNDLTEAERYLMSTSAYRERLLDVCRESGNLAGAEVKPESRQLILFGVGKPSPAVAAAMQEAPADVSVTWQECPYTLDELGRETTRLMRLHPDRLNTGGPNNTYTGLEFTTLDESLLASSDATAALGAAYPVTVRPGGPVAFA